MVYCYQRKDQPYTLEDVVMRALCELHVPVAYGLHSGHVTSGNITLPIGVRAAMKVTSEGLTLKMLESATASSSSRAESVKTL